jgi:hypothetical protein
MATGKGVIQGYTGVAAVDDTHQIADCSLRSLYFIRSHVNSGVI